MKNKFLIIGSAILAVVLVVILIITLIPAKPVQEPVKDPVNSTVSTATVTVEDIEKNDEDTRGGHNLLRHIRYRSYEYRAVLLCGASRNTSLLRLRKV